MSDNFQRSGLCTDGPSQNADNFAPSAPAAPSVTGIEQSANVIVYVPDRALDIKGSFSYFGIKWDGHDIANAHPGDYVNVSTVTGRHTLEIRQVNNTLFKTNIVRFSFDIRTDSQSNFKIVSNGSAFELMSQ